MIISRKEFRKRVEEKRLLAVPGVYDALTAKLVRSAGFEAAYLTGAGVSYSTLGQPDLGLISFKEMADALERVTQSSDLPLIADADNGYGNALNIHRTVAAYERAGAYAIQIEDQQWPKKCGHMSDKQIIPLREAVQHIQAAVDARRNNDTLIIARTDALAVHGLDDALERALRFVEVGADVIFMEAPQTAEEMRRVCDTIQVPCLANMVEGGRTPLFTWSELEQIGYRVAIYPNTITRILARQVTQALQTLKRDETSTGLLKDMMLFRELNQLLGIDELHELEQRYATGEE